MAVGGSDGRVYLVDDTNATVVRYPIRLPLNPGGVESVAFNSKSRYLLTSNSRGNITLWDLKRKVVCREFKGHVTGRVKKAIFDKRDQHVISGGVTGKVLLHNIRSGSVSLELQHPDRSSVEHCCIPCIDSGFSHLLASSHANGSVHVWDVNGGTKNAVVAWQAHSNKPAIATEILPDRPVLISAGGNGKVEMFDLRDRKGVTAEQGFAFGSAVSSSPFTSLSCHPSDSLVLVGSSDGQIYLLDLRQRGETKAPVLVTKRVTSGRHEPIVDISWRHGKFEDSHEHDQEFECHQSNSSSFISTTTTSLSPVNSILGGGSGGMTKHHGEDTNHLSSERDGNNRVIITTPTTTTPSSLRNNTTMYSSSVIPEESAAANVDTQVIRQVIRDVIEESRGQLHTDIQNLHLDVLKQFQQQADEFHQLLMPLTEIIDRLAQENK